MQKVIIFGCGYTARHLKPFLNNAAVDVVETSQTGRDQTVIFNQHTPLDFSLLQDTTHVLVSIPPYQGRDLVADMHGVDLLRLPNVTWVGYLSSTSVYGDHQGAWVYEESPTHPQTHHGMERLKAEAAWTKLYAQGLPLHIFRLSGIYGPDRSVFEKLKAGMTSCPVVKGHVFSRIHVLDAARILRASMDQPAPGNIYNVADDLPASSYEVMAYGAKLLGLNPPTAVDLNDGNLSLKALDFYKDSKKVANQKIKTTLGIKLVYPTYVQGLNSFT